VFQSGLKCGISFVTSNAAVCELSTIHPVFEQCSVSVRIKILDLKRMDEECVGTFSSWILWRCRLSAAETSAVRCRSAQCPYSEKDPHENRQFIKPHTVSQPVSSFPAWTTLQHSAVSTLQTQTRKRKADYRNRNYFSVINWSYFVIFVILNSTKQKSPQQKTYFIAQKKKYNQQSARIKT
jgi:hypothetical protein